MIGTFRIDTTVVGYCAIDADGALKRREREKEAVKRILQHLGENPDALTHASDGAPLLPGKHISISHSAKLAVVAIDRLRPIGIDAEEERPQLVRVKGKFLSEQEMLVFTSLMQLLHAWTIKEAVYKVAGPRAVDFKEAIAVSADLQSATCLGAVYAISSVDIDATHISLATNM